MEVGTVYTYGLMLYLHLNKQLNKTHLSNRPSDNPRDKGTHEKKPFLLQLLMPFHTYAVFRFVASVSFERNCCNFFFAFFKKKPDEIV